uniref:ACT domain-containing protein n=1 Tax=Panagrellus redivivus TaxID=6233 RepID=A0A7E4VZE6_PANRE
MINNKSVRKKCPKCDVIVSLQKVKGSRQNSVHDFGGQLDKLFRTNDFRLITVTSIFASITEVFERQYFDDRFFQRIQNEWHFVILSATKNIEVCHRHVRCAVGTSRAMACVQYKDF